jgi:hypothetical protein
MTEDLAVAFIKFFPFENREWLPVSDVLDRMRDEFRMVDADREEGRDYIGGVIVAMLRLPNDLPGYQEQLAFLQAIQDQAVCVTFGDSDDIVASCCLAPERDMFFDSPGELAGPGRQLIERLAGALSYELYEG